MHERLDSLPSDPDALRASIAGQVSALAAMDAELHSRDPLVEKLEAQLAALRCLRFGTSSEKVKRSIAQLEMALAEIEATVAKPPSSSRGETLRRARPVRRAPPAYLPHDERYYPARAA